jgi:hypothetical protein
MTTSAQLVSMAARAKPTETAPEASKAPERAPTNASLPILAPAHVPQPIPFSAPPAGMTAGQKAAHTRQARAMGIGPAKAEPAPKASTPARAEGVELILTIAPEGESVAVRFAFRLKGAAIEAGSVSQADRPFLSLSAVCHRFQGDELVPASGLTFEGKASADDLAEALPLMRKATASLLHAYEETEDASFPQMVLTLAGILRADRVEYTPPGGDLVSAKRGAAYITAFKASEAFKPVTPA